MFYEVEEKIIVLIQNSIDTNCRVIHGSHLSNIFKVKDFYMTPTWPSAFKLLALNVFKAYCTLVLTQDLQNMFKRLNKHFVLKLSWKFETSTSYQGGCRRWYDNTHSVTYTAYTGKIWTGVAALYKSKPLFYAFGALQDKRWSVHTYIKVHFFLLKNFILNTMANFFFVRK